MILPRWRGQTGRASLSVRRPRRFASPWQPPPLPPPAKRRRLLCGQRSRRRASAMFFGAHRAPRVLLPVAVALAIATSALVMAPPASASTCWQRVIADWRDGRVDGTYSASCLRDAIRNLPEDLRIYGSAEEDITRASKPRRSARRKQRRRTSPRTATRSRSARRSWPRPQAWWPSPSRPRCGGRAADEGPRP